MCPPGYPGGSALNCVLSLQYIGYLMLVRGVLFPYPIFLGLTDSSQIKSTISTHHITTGGATNIGALTLANGCIGIFFIYSLQKIYYAISLSGYTGH